MKKIFYLFGLIALFYSCTNHDVVFDDFAHQGIYFPYQYPVRSLMLGDEVIGDNSIDLAHAFSIGVSMGGVYANTKDREVSVAFAPELAAKITDASGNMLELLPASYFNATFGKIIIPAGSFMGKMRVNLTDAFFNDPLTTGLHYVVPVRITSAAPGDSVLQGSPVPGIASPDPRNTAHWLITPKNFVLFAVKYINPTHGVYLIRGKRTNKANPLDVVTYSKRFIDDNDMTKLTTKSLTENYMSTVGGTNKELSNAKYSMILTFNSTGKSVMVSQKSASTVVVSGTGKYFSKTDPGAESYNGAKHRTIYLDYTYQDGVNSYQAKDSLVYVDDDMKFEEFQVVVTP